MPKIPIHLSIWMTIISVGSVLARAETHKGIAGKQEFKKELHVNKYSPYLIAEKNLF